MCMLLVTSVMFGFRTSVCTSLLCYPLCVCAGLTGFVLSLSILVPNSISEVRLSPSFCCLVVILVH
jgi:hypothetical protein